MIVIRSAAFAISLAMTLGVAAQTIQVNRDNRTVAITATDRVKAIADEATVHVGFIAYGSDSNTAYANGSRVSNWIVKALTSAAVAKETTQRENQQLSPAPNYHLD